MLNFLVRVSRLGRGVRLLFMLKMVLVMMSLILVVLVVSVVCRVVRLVCGKCVILVLARCVVLISDVWFNCFEKILVCLLFSVVMMVRLVM